MKRSRTDSIKRVISGCGFTLFIVIVCFFPPFSLLYSQTPEWEKFPYSFGDIKNKYVSVEFCDIDADGDMDLFTGNWNGFMGFYQNIGTPDRFLFKKINGGTGRADSFNRIGVGNRAVPRFSDIDADGDMDLFVGNNDGNIAFFRNDGDARHPLFKTIRDGTDPPNSYFNISTGLAAAPFFADIDNDGDDDLFVGNALGFIAFYKNDGTATSPLFTRIRGGYAAEDSFENISTEKYAVPFFRDFNNVGLFDLFIGNWNGTLYYFKNAGTPEKPKYTLISKNFGQISVQGDSTPAFADLNNDSRDEILLGNNKGEIQLFSQKSRRKLMVFRPKGVAAVSNKVVEGGMPLLEQINRAAIDEEYYETAKKLFTANDPVEAYNILETRIKKKSEKVRNLIKSCNQQIQKLHAEQIKDSFLMKEVMNEFKTALRDYTHGNYEKSIEAFTAVINTAPNNRISVEFKARASKKLAEQKNHIDAAKSFTDALSEYKNGNTDKAVFFIRDAVRLAPSNIEYRLHFATFSNIHAVRQNQVFYQTNMRKAEESIKSSRYDDALERLYAIKGLFPEDKEVQKKIILCEEQSAGAANLNNARMMKLYAQKGDEAFQANDFEKAVNNYRTALKYSPKNQELKNKISMSQARLQKTAAPVDAQAVKEHLQKGLEYYSLRQYENAITAWKRALEIDPANPVAQKNIEKAKLMLKK